MSEGQEHPEPPDSHVLHACGTERRSQEGAGTATPVTTGNILRSITGTHDILVQAKYFSPATNCACVCACGHVWACLSEVCSGETLDPSNRARNEFIEMNKWSST